MDKSFFIQQYNFLNHFKWFIEGKPEGHVTNYNLFNRDMIKYYNKFLITNEIADTIFIEAKINSKR